MSSFEKSVKGGTKIKLAAPKSKYVEHILLGTHAGETGVADVFKTLQLRLRDSTWTIVFKALIIVHLMIREGEPGVTLKFLADAPSKLDTGSISDVQIQGSNIRHYSRYLISRVKGYRDTKLDWVKEGQGRLKRQTIDKGLLRETECVQNQIAALLKCDLLSNEPENEISLTAFRLLTMDLLILYHVMNEGTINVLEHYFEMSKYDAERAFAIYKTFSKQTNMVVEFLSVARQHQNATRLEIPKLKHAPTSLTASLEEYLNDPDFEINRRQYLAQQEAKKTGKHVAPNGVKESRDEFRRVNPNDGSGGQGESTFRPTQVAPPKSEPKGPAPDLIDFFESIEQNQQPLAAPPQQPVPQYQHQQQGFPGQSIFPTGHAQAQQQINNSFGNPNPFDQLNSPQPVQQDLAGVGFGGYNNQSPQAFSPSQTGLSSIPQNGVANFPPQHQPFAIEQQPQSTNPFRQSILSQPTASSSSSSFSNPPTFTSSLNRQSTNPFARNISTQSTGLSQGTPFASSPPLQTPQSGISSARSSLFSSPAIQSPQTSFQSVQPAQPLQPARTGTNPFSRNPSQPKSQSQTTITSPIVPNLTGSTNPFRQSAFVNHQTGQGWQATQGTLGGLENLETIPVFPRTGQSQPQSQPWP